ADGAGRVDLQGVDGAGPEAGSALEGEAQVLGDAVRRVRGAGVGGGVAGAGGEGESESEPESESEGEAGGGGEAAGRRRPGAHGSTLSRAARLRTRSEKTSSSSFSPAEVTTVASPPRAKERMAPVRALRTTTMGYASRSQVRRTARAEARRSAARAPAWGVGAVRAAMAAGAGVMIRSTPGPVRRMDARRSPPASSLGSTNAKWRVTRPWSATESGVKGSAKRRFPAASYPSRV